LFAPAGLTALRENSRSPAAGFLYQIIFYNKGPAAGTVPARIFKMPRKIKRSQALKVNIFFKNASDKLRANGVFRQSSSSIFGNPALIFKVSAGWQNCLSAEAEAEARVVLPPKIRENFAGPAIGGAKAT